MLPIDLSVVNADTNQIKVRLVGGKGFFEIEDISMDFGENPEFTVIELVLDSAIKNGTENVMSDILTSNDENRVHIMKGKHVDTSYQAIELAEGYQRGFIVEFNGYFTVGESSKKAPIEMDWANKSLEEIMSEVLAVQPEAASALESLNEILMLAEEIQHADMNTQIYKVIVEKVLPWLNN